MNRNEVQQDRCNVLDIDLATVLFSRE